MRVGQPVEGLMTQNWSFVESDLYNICERVKEYDKDAALGVHTDGHLGLLRYVVTDFAPSGAWIVCFNLDDPLTEDGRWYGEPDSRVLDQMARADLHKREPRDLVKKLQLMWKLEQFRQEAEDAEYARDLADRTIYKYRKKEGQKRRIYVP